MDSGWETYVACLVAEAATPREIVRRVTDRLECLWWAGAPAIPASSGVAPRGRRG
jgi:hypothetical protein